MRASDANIAERLEMEIGLRWRLMHKGRRDVARLRKLWDKPVYAMDDFDEWKLARSVTRSHRGILLTLLDIRRGG